MTGEQLRLLPLTARQANDLRTKQQAATRRPGKVTTKENPR